MSTNNISQTQNADPSPKAPRRLRNDAEPRVPAASRPSAPKPRNEAARAASEEPARVGRPPRGKGKRHPLDLRATPLSDLPNFLLVAELAKLARVSERTVRQWIADKILPSVQPSGPGGAMLIAKSEALRVLGHGS